MPATRPTAWFPARAPTATSRAPNSDSSRRVRRPRADAAARICEHQLAQHLEPRHLGTEARASRVARPGVTLMPTPIAVHSGRWPRQRDSTSNPPSLAAGEVDVVRPLRPTGVGLNPGRAPPPPAGRSARTARRAPPCRSVVPAASARFLRLSAIPSAGLPAPAPTAARQRSTSVSPGASASARSAATSIVDGTSSSTTTWAARASRQRVRRHPVVLSPPPPPRQARAASVARTTTPRTRRYSANTPKLCRDTKRSNTAIAAELLTAAAAMPTRIGVRLRARPERVRRLQHRRGQRDRKLIEEAEHSRRTAVEPQEARTGDRGTGPRVHLGAARGTR